MNRRLMIVLTGHAVTSTGDAMAGLALSWWVLSSTGSAALMSLVAVVTLLSGVLAGPLAGTFADRHDRRTILIVTESARAVVYATMAWLAFSDSLNLSSALVGVAVSRILGSAYTPSMFAIIPQLTSASGLERANAWAETLSNGSSLWGPALGGVAYGAFGLSGVLGLNALSFGVSALSLAAVRLPAPAVARSDRGRPSLGCGPFPEDGTGGEVCPNTERRRSERSGYWDDLRAGLAFVCYDALLVYQMVTSNIINLFINMIILMLPVLTLRQFQEGPQAYGLLQAALPLGMIVGAQTSDRLLPWVAESQRFLGINVTAVVLLLILAFSDRLIPDALALVMVGAILGMSNVLITGVLQRRIPPELQARAWAAMSTLQMALTPAGQAAAGVLTDSIGVSPTIIVAAGGAAVGLWFTRHLRGYWVFLEALRSVAKKKPSAQMSV